MSKQMHGMVLSLLTKEYVHQHQQPSSEQGLATNLVVNRVVRK